MRVTLSVAAALTLASCDSGTEQQREVASTRAVMRPNAGLPTATVPRGAQEAAAALQPPGLPVTAALLRRGQERFTIYCAPCHGARGHGDGIVVSRGFPPPPSYHEERLRAVPPEHVVRIITDGNGRMYPYADRVLPADRWAIAHYVKALQAQEPPQPPAPEPPR